MSQYEMNERNYSTMDTSVGRLSFRSPAVSPVAMDKHQQLLFNMSLFQALYFPISYNPQMLLSWNGQWSSGLSNLPLI